MESNQYEVDPYHHYQALNRQYLPLPSKKVHIPKHPSKFHENIREYDQAALYVFERNLARRKSQQP